MNHLPPRYSSDFTTADTTGFFDFYTPFPASSHLTGNLQKDTYFFRFFDFSHHGGKKVTGPAEVRSAFTGDVQKVSSGIPKPLAKHSSDWLALLLIAFLIIVAWIRAIYSKRLSQVFRAALFHHHVNQLEREGPLFNERISIGLTFIYITAVALLINLLLSWHTGTFSAGSSLLQFGIAFAMILGLVIFKFIMISLSGNLMKTSDAAHHHILTIIIFNHVAGLVLFPVVVGSLYLHNEILLWTGCGILALSLLLRFGRVTVIGISNRAYSPFYLFLYLCTLEILPVLLLVKFATSLT